MLSKILNQTLIVLLCVLGLAHTAAAAIPVPPPPSLDAESYVLMDYQSAQIIAAKAPDKRIEPASLTKLMTTYIVFAELERGKIQMDDMVPVSVNAWRTGGSRMFIEPNTKVSVQDLLHGVIVQSGNDASVALAEYIAGTEPTFAAYMNQVAAKLGLTNTHFTNATGLPDPKHYTTAHDLAILTRALIQDFPDHYKLFAKEVFTYNKIKQYNRNGLLRRDPSVDGLKTGHTQSAGYCLVASAERDGTRLISVVTGANSEEGRLNASLALLNYGYRFYETVKLYDGGKPVESIAVWKGESDMLPVGVRDNLFVTVPRGHRKNLTSQAVIQSRLTAPIEQGQQIGTLKVSLDGEVLSQKPLYALEAVPLGSWWTRLVDQVHLFVRDF